MMALIVGSDMVLFGLAALYSLINLTIFSRLAIPSEISSSLLLTSNKPYLPSVRAIITDDQYGYLSNEGIYIIPIGCLKN